MPTVPTASFGWLSCYPVLLIWLRLRVEGGAASGHTACGLSPQPCGSGNRGSAGASFAFDHGPSRKLACQAVAQHSGAPLRYARLGFEPCGDFDAPSIFRRLGCPARPLPIDSLPCEMLVDRQVSKGRAAVRVITYDPGVNWAIGERRSDFRNVWRCGEMWGDSVVVPAPRPAPCSLSPSSAV